MLLLLPKVILVVVEQEEGRQDTRDGVQPPVSTARFFCHEAVIVSLEEVTRNEELQGGG